MHLVQDGRGQPGTRTYPDDQVPEQPSLLMYLHIERNTWSHTYINVIYNQQTVTLVFKYLWINFDI